MLHNFYTVVAKNIHTYMRKQKNIAVIDGFTLRISVSM